MGAAALSTARCRVDQPSAALSQCVHVGDVGASIAAALKAAPGKPRAYNISPRQEYSLEHVRDVVRSVVGPLEVELDETNDVVAYRLPRMSIRHAPSTLAIGRR
ncbi:hypothetical protein BH23BAC4_BH23BAC4_01840 [soil metagenome]